MTSYPITLVALFLISVGFGLFYLAQRRRWRRQLDHALILPEGLPAGASLEQLERLFQEIVGSKLLGRRLARLCAVLFDPHLVREYIDDPYLVSQIESGKLHNNTALFLCVGAVEEVVEGRTFRNDPANTLGAYLRSEFRKRGWLWPKHPYAWKQHFVEHHANVLF